MSRSKTPTPPPCPTSRITSLTSETRAALDTETAAFHLNRRPQTLRAWASGDNGPIRPQRLNGRLLWSTTELRRLVEAGTPELPHNTAAKAFVASCSSGARACCNRQFDLLATDRADLLASMSIEPHEAWSAAVGAAARGKAQVEGRGRAAAEEECAP